MKDQDTGRVMLLSQGHVFLQPHHRLYLFCPQKLDKGMVLSTALQQFWTSKEVNYFVVRVLFSGNLIAASNFNVINQKAIENSVMLNY